MKNAWLIVAAVLVALASQLTHGAATTPDSATCPEAQADAAAPPPDFLFASGQEWKRFALEAELDVHH